MKKIINLLLFFSMAYIFSISSIFAADKIVFLKNYEEAASQAKKQKKPLMILGARKTCGNCRYMKNAVLTNAIFKKMAEKFICLEIDADSKVRRVQYWRYKIFKEAGFKGGRYRLPSIVFAVYDPEKKDSLSRPFKKIRGYRHTTGVVKVNELVKEMKETYAFQQELNKKISSSPYFFIQNQNQAFKYSSENMVGRWTGTAYVAKIDESLISLIIVSKGINPNNGKEETRSFVLKINYNTKTGEYTSGPDGEFQLKGKVNESGAFSMNHSQGGIRLEVTSKPKYPLISKTPDFFIKNKNKIFDYKAKLTPRGVREGTAKIKSIVGNKIVISITAPFKNFQTGGKSIQTLDYKLYYINGIYSNNIKLYNTWGVAVGSSKSIKIYGNKGFTVFTVK